MTNKLSPQVPADIEAEPLLESTDTGGGDDTYPAAVTDDQEFQPMSMAPETEQDEDESAWLAELRQRPWYRRPGLLWTAPLVFAIGLVMGVIGSPMAQLNIQIICKDLLPPDALKHVGLALDDDRCRTPEVLGTAALVESQISALRGTITLFTLAKWASFSDIYGRKFVLWFSLGATTVSQMTIWFAASSYNPFGYRLLYLDSMLLGITAGASLFHPTISAYISDCTSTTSRSITLGYTSTAFALGFAIGPSLGGYVVKITNSFTSVIRISLTSFVILMIYLIFMPESLRKPIKSSASDNKVTRPVQLSFFAAIWDAVLRGLYSIVEPLLFFAPGTIPVSPKAPSRYTLALIISTNFLINLSVMGVFHLFIPLTNLVFKWTSYEDGLLFTFSGFSSFAAFLGVFPLLQYVYKRCVIKDPNSRRDGYIRVEQAGQQRGTTLESFSLEEEQSAPAPGTQTQDMDTITTLKMDATFYFGCTILYGVSYLIVPLFKSVPVIYVAEGLLQIASISSSASTSMLTTVVPSSQTGKALGASSVSLSLASTAAALIYGMIFAWTSTTMPWLYYYVSAGVSLLAAFAGESQEQDLLFGIPGVERHGNSRARVKVLIQGPS
ncbi:major facilitator superfamily domain-containing protein [Mortierella sp. GBAus27b]|nr:major facilitator superfamily domain-containing protein [Mortierella sp. GBAus27b]